MWWDAYPIMAQKILPLVKMFQKNKKHGHPCDFESNEEWQKVIDEIRYSITEAIDNICERENFNISYTEINAALTDIIRRFLGLIDFLNSSKSIN
jgi:hypothetical protein